jgi:hypothetical protein
MTPQHIRSFFTALSNEDLSVEFTYEETKGDTCQFEKLIRTYFSKSLADMIFLEDMHKDLSLLICGTPWENLIAKWRLSLS